MIKLLLILSFLMVFSVCAELDANVQDSPILDYPVIYIYPYFWIYPIDEQPVVNVIPKGIVSDEVVDDLCSDVVQKRSFVAYEL